MVMLEINFLQTHIKPFHRSGEAGLLLSGRADRSKAEASRYVQHLAVDHRKLCHS